jgi:2-methylisocitrate lyase-like PEP mutase family enzyme
MTTVAGRDASALAERADVLRRLHAGPRPLVLPNAWDVASARLVVKAGFPVVATSSGAVTATLGYEDNDSMPVDEAFGVIARITRSVSVPVTADVEAGYGLSPGDLVERLLEAGAVGCNLEDTDHHRGAGLVDAGEHAERLRAVRHAATEAGVDVVLNARVDVLRREGDRRELFEEAVRRARLYLEAGADCVFPIRLADDALIGEFVRRVEGPVNIVAAGAPPLARLAELGVARVSFAGSLMGQLYGAHEARLSEIAAELGPIA